MRESAGQRDGQAVADPHALAAALDSVSEGVVIIDRAGFVVHANAVARASGVQVGVPEAEDLFAPITTTGLPYPRRARPGPVAMRTGRAVRAVEMGVLGPDGTIHWLVLDAIPVDFDDDGGCTHVAVAYREVTREWTQRAELEARVATERLLATLSRDLARATADTLVAHLDGALHELCLHVGVDRARVGRVSDDGAELACLAHWCAPGTQPAPQWLDPIVLAEVPFAHTMLASGAVVAADVAELPTALWREADRLGAPRAATMLIAPLAVEGEILGALALERDTRAPWTASQRGMVEQLAAVLGATVARVRAEQDRRRTQEFLELLMSNSPDLIAAIDSDTRPFYLSPGVARLFGFGADDWVGVPIVEQVHPDDVEVARDRLAQAFAGTPSDPTELRLRHADGRWIWVDCAGRPIFDGDRVTGVVINVRDVSERKRAAEALAAVEREFVRRLEYEATHDPLTGLPQRKLVLEHLDRALGSRGVGPASTAVLFIDLDHFKRVNDSLGHACGDQLLEAFAERLKCGVRGQDLAGRLGGDEFVVVCPGARTEQEALAIGQRMLALVEEPFTIEGVEVFVGASIGIALADAEINAATLLRQADTAAYRAKETGRNHCELFDDDLRAEVEHRLATETALRHALERGELLLHYQPIVLTDDASVCAFEALARWNRPGAGIVAPDNFLAIAEESGLIVPLGLEVFRLGCGQAAQWQQTFGADAPMVCINLSVLQLVQADFMASIRAILDDTGVDPSQICLEITESSIMQDPDRTIVLLEELRTLGLALAIDDFGTGYSSLSHLRQLPVDVLKIDRSFVLEIGVDHEGATIVASIVALAHALGITIVAEGVETVEHVAVLHNLGCDRMQGFYFSMALPADEATSVIARGRLPGPNAATA